MPHPLRLGLKLSGQSTTISDLRSVWRVADEAGFDHLWVFDHLASIGADGENRPVYEGWTLLGAMAQATRRVRLGCMVTGNTYRHPAVLAKMAATVDHLSGGRLEFGIGAAWAEAEHSMYGIEGLDHRVGRLRESLQAIISLWTEERTTLDGRYYRLRDAVFNPRPVQQPYPPIWIGGGGEQMLRIVARYADVWAISGDAGMDRLSELNSILEEACGQAQRDPADIRRSCQLMWDGADPDWLTSQVGERYRLDFSEIIINLRPASAVVAAEAAARLLPELRGVAVAGQPRKA